MQSFRTELENPLVEQDIIDLERKIKRFRDGEMDEERFRSLRLARGVYGQRQPGVQMVRIKLPFGRMSTRQLRRIAAVSDAYSTGKLHLTTRQDIQIHFVSLERTPELWAELERDEVTLREACGNTVRNITGSAIAGIDPEEPFDIAPYADAMFRYFLRNPVCQEMGRKFKIAFSSSDQDTAYTFMHDLGFLPRVRHQGGEERRGFRVLIGGGLGAQPVLALPAYEFLPEDQIVPFTEAVLRVFDRHGERAKRMKARIKYLIKEIGLEAFMQLVEDEWPALPYKSYPIDREALAQPAPPTAGGHPEGIVPDGAKYERWLRSNVFEQKQAGFYAAQLRVALGDISTDTARRLADLVDQTAADDIRITVNQGLLLKFIRPESLPYLFQQLDALGLAEPGFYSTADVTACPGTDTCNLGISNSTGIAQVLSAVIDEEYPHLIFDKSIKIKISGCMNSCGQHGMANIGFHGSSLKQGKQALPALQVLLGGGVEGGGEGSIAEKVIKIPSKRGPQALRRILDEYESQAEAGESFNAYYRRTGKKHFYDLLKDLAQLGSLQEDEFLDWGHSERYEKQVGTGECAGVIVDLVQTLLYETEEKLGFAHEAFAQRAFADAIYHAYNTFVNAAKALLTAEDIKTNSQHKILQEFDAHFVEGGRLALGYRLEERALRLRQNEPTEAFAAEYLEEAGSFYQRATAYRQSQLDA